MRIKLIVAVSEDGYIGKPDGNLPFKLQEDMIRFKSLTSGHPVVVGRKTFDSLPFILPKRDHFVITAKRLSFFDSLERKGVGDAGEVPVYQTTSFLNLPTMLRHFGNKSQNDYSEVWIIGGSEIYIQAFKFLPIDQVELTLVHTKFEEADSTWAKFEMPVGWDITDSRRMSADENNEHDYSFITYKKQS